MFKTRSFALSIFFCMIIICNGCLKNEVSPDIENHFDICKVKSLETYRNQALEFKKNIEYDEELNPLQISTWDIYRFNKVVLTYNDDKQLMLKAYFSGDNENSYNKYSEELFFYNNKSQLEYTIIKPYPSGEEWKNFEFEYHANGKLKKKIERYSNGSLGISLEYNDKGDLIKEDYNHSGMYGQYEYNSNRELLKYEFFVEGKLIKGTYQEYGQGGKLIKFLEKGLLPIPNPDYYFREITYVYNSNGKLELEVLKTWDEVTPKVTTKKTEFQYNAQNFLVKVSIFFDDVLALYEMVENDSQGNEITRKVYSAYPSTPKLVEEITTTYSSSGNIASKIFHKLPYPIEIIEYDNMGNQIYRSYTDYDGIEVFKEVTKYACK